MNNLVYAILSPIIYTYIRKSVTLHNHQVSENHANLYNFFLMKQYKMQQNKGDAYDEASPCEFSFVFYFLRIRIFLPFIT